MCHKRRIPVVAYSGGTSLEGHFTPTRGGISIDFSRMDKILSLHKDDLDVVVQPAVGWELLNEELGKDNLFFPPDPGPGAMIGGMVGTGCSGTNAYRYGTMREWVLSLTVVLADGTIIKTRQRPRKSSAGYDLTKLFIGSEGTLGLVTEATLKLAVKPQATSVAVASFGSIRQAADCVAAVVGDGVLVAAVEILDDDQMRFINLAGMTSRSCEGGAHHLLQIQRHGPGRQASRSRWCGSWPGRTAATHLSCQEPCRAVRAVERAEGGAVEHNRGEAARRPRLDRRRGRACQPAARYHRRDEERCEEERAHELDRGPRRRRQLPP